MNNPNPFVPKGSLLEEQSKRRSHLKLAVLCAVAIGGIGLMGMLIQGCKREQVSEENQNPPPADTNTVAVDTNPPPMVASNPPVAPPPVVVQPPPAQVFMGDTGSLALGAGRDRIRRCAWRYARKNCEAERRDAQCS